MITLYYYLVVIVIQDEDPREISCNATYIRASDSQKALIEAVKELPTSTKLLAGGRIITKSCTKVPSFVCPMHENSHYQCYLEDDKITSVTFNIHRSNRTQFVKADIEEFLAEHF